MAAASMAPRKADLPALLCACTTTMFPAVAIFAPAMVNSASGSGGGALRLNRRASSSASSCSASPSAGGLIT
jgi:hypothetical protein